MRIIHLSDTHYATRPENLLSACFDKRILGLINYVTRRRGKMHNEFLTETVDTILGMKPDVVVCSGDITVIGSEREFAGAAERLKPLVESPDFDFIYVPGNHDAYSGARRCRAALRDTFFKLNRERWMLEQLPQEVRIGNVRFFVVNEDRPTNIFLSTGYIRGQTADRLAAWFNEPRGQDEVRVLVGHHPTRLANGRRTAFRRRLVGGDLVHDALIQGNLDLSLCGHIHDPFVRSFDSGAREICAGSLTTNGRMVEIDIDEPTGEIEVKWLTRTGAPL